MEVQSDSEREMERWKYRVIVRERGRGGSTGGERERVVEVHGEREGVVEAEGEISKGRERKRGRGRVQRKCYEPSAQS